MPQPFLEVVCPVCTAEANKVWDDEEQKFVSRETKPTPIYHFEPACNKPQPKKGGVTATLKSQSKYLAEIMGLRQVEVSNDKGVWITVEKIAQPDKTGSLSTEIEGIDVRGDRIHFIDGENYALSRDPTPNTDEVTEREKKAYLKSIEMRVVKQ